MLNSALFQGQRVSFGPMITCRASWRDLVDLRNDQREFAVEIAILSLAGHCLHPPSTMSCTMFADAWWPSRRVWMVHVLCRCTLRREGGEAEGVCNKAACRHQIVQTLVVGGKLRSYIDGSRRRSLSNNGEVANGLSARLKTAVESQVGFSRACRARSQFGLTIAFFRAHQHVSKMGRGRHCMRCTRPDSFGAARPLSHAMRCGTIVPQTCLCACVHQHLKS